MQVLTWQKKYEAISVPKITADNFRTALRPGCIDTLEKALGVLPISEPDIYLLVFCAMSTD